MRILLLPGMDGTGKLFAPFLKVLPRSIKTTVVRYPNESLSYDELFKLVRASAPTEEPFVVQNLSQDRLVFASRLCRREI